MIKNNDEKDTAYSAEYDAYYNPVTNEWIDTKCDDPTCEFCSTRPAQPLKDLPWACIYTTPVSALAASAKAK